MPPKCPSWLPKPVGYEVPRLASVPSSCLGYTQWVFYVMVAVYTIGWVLVRNQQYLSFEAPEGTARLSLACPGKTSTSCLGFVEDTAALPYCQLGHPAAAQIQNMDKNYSGDARTRPCQFRDEFFAQFPPVENNAMFASTRITESSQQLSSACRLSGTGGGRTKRACVDWENKKSETFFLTQLEDFTVMIDHSFVAPIARKSGSPSWVDPDSDVKAGWICAAPPKASDLDNAFGSGTDAACAQGSKYDLDPCDDYTSRNLPCPSFIHVGAPKNIQDCKDTTGCKDIVPLRTLLRAAGITDLDTQGDYKGRNGALQSHRYAGLILHVKIVFTNHEGKDSSNLDTFNYHYEVQHVSGAPFKGVQVIDSDPLNDDNRVVLERHGVRLVFTVTGSIGRWNLFQVPVALSAGAAILGLLMFCMNTIVLNRKVGCCRSQQEWAAMFESAKYDGDYRGVPLSVQSDSSRSSAYGDLTANLEL